MEYKLPDFDEMLGISDEVGNLTTTIELLKVSLDDLLGRITFTVTNDPSYWSVDSKGNKKPPAMNYIMATYHRRGFDVETKESLEKLRNEIAKKSGELGRLKMVFSVYREMINVWKADQYNKREANY
jgi:hypothetical protein